ncbi:MAG: glutamyl-tRNA reductase [Blastochloris sp.]|nr:glutamyl-tRNA reductase [Blastochloris sp.]
MNFYCIGIDHRSMSVDIREQLSFAGEEMPMILSFFSLHKSFAEMVILSTCNRVEFYFASSLTPARAHKELQASVEDFLNIPSTGLDHAYVYRNLDAIDHLFEVCTGLHSMVIGETEILGQTKSAYQIAKNAKCCGPILNRSFQNAFSAAKDARTRTNIGRGNVSVASVAVNTAERLVGNLWDKKVLVLGAGDVGQEVTKALADRGVQQVLCSSRSSERSLNLAEHYGMKSIAWSAWKNQLCEVDIIVASTSAPDPILTKQDLLPFKQRLLQRPLFILDLAVPRDVDPSVGQLTGVCLFNVDNLKDNASENLTSRWSERSRCLEILQPAGKKLFAYFQKQHTLSSANFTNT